MRPEYVQSVEAAQWGVTFWAMILLPTIIVWGAALSPVWAKPGRRRLILILGTLLAMVTCWFFVVFHANYVQDTKGRHAQTDEEWDDWSADTGVVFAPITAIPVSIIYCGIHLLPALCVYFALKFIVRNRATSPDNDLAELGTAPSTSIGENPYQSPTS